MKRQMLGIVVTVLVFSSCGIKIKRSKSDNDVIDPQREGQEGLDFPKPIASCDKAKPLSAEGIAFTSYGLYLKDDGKDTKVVSEPKDLCVQDTSRSYGKDTLEGAALASIKTLSDASKFHKTLEGAKRIVDAELNIFPKFEEQVKDSSGKTVSMYWSANLAYVSELRDNTPVFFVFPHGSVGKKLWGDAFRLWETSFGLAHEFGHHVFNEYTTFGSKSTLHLEGLLQPWHANSGVKIEKNNLIMGQSERHLKAVDEGFADLFAFSAIEKVDLGGLRCFEKSRDISSDVFADGQAKSVNDDVLYQFDREVEPSGSTGPCSVTDFSDVHMLGAVVAHGAYKFMSKSSKGELDRKARGALLLKWAETIRRTNTSFSELDDIMVEFVRTMGKELGSTTQEQCQVAKQVFPALTRTVEQACQMFKTAL